MPLLLCNDLDLQRVGFNFHEQVLRLHAGLDWDGHLNRLQRLGPRVRVGGACINKQRNQLLLKIELISPLSYRKSATQKCVALFR